MTLSVVYFDVIRNSHSNILYISLNQLFTNLHDVLIMN